MKQAELVAKMTQRFKVTNWQNPKAEPAPNLLKQNFTAAAPKQVWLANITYIHTWEGWLYVAAVLDLFSRRIVSLAMSGRMTTDLPATAESFLHTLKTERIYFEDYQTTEEAKISIFEYVEVFYNRTRRHSTLGYLSPAAFEQ